VGSLLVAGASLACVGCAVGSGDSDAQPDALHGRDSTEEPASPSEEKAGSLWLALTTQASVTFTSFSYAITGPNFTKPGSIDVSDSTTVSALIDGIPIGTGYSLTITGESVPKEGSSLAAQCSGSANFDVAGGAVTEVPVSIGCHLTGEPDGPPTVAAVPIPPVAPFALGLLLLAGGSVAAGRRRQRAV
jgi:hypothetical protein